jgi:hypothetical protein
MRPDELIDNYPDDFTLAALAKPGSVSAVADSSPNLERRGAIGGKLMALFLFLEKDDAADL